MFRTILDGERTKLSDLANTFLKRGNQHAALRCYDCYFEQLPSLTDEDIEKIASDLHQFSDYVHTLRKFVFLSDPASNSRTCRLFGIRAGEEKGMIVLLKPNILYDSSNTLNSKGNLELSQEDFLKALEKCLKARLVDRVTRENDICRKSQALHTPPCLNHIIFSKPCDSSPCSLLHTSADFLWSQYWIKAHLLQIDVYHSISGLQYLSEFRAQQR